MCMGVGVCPRMHFATGEPKLPELLHIVKSAERRLVSLIIDAKAVHKIT